jgi:hypothetical protein
MPTFGAIAPLSYYAVPEHERAKRCSLGTDECVIDESHFFVRGSLEIPVHGEKEPFAWGVWVSLSKASFEEWVSAFHMEKRAHLDPYFGWLDAWLKPYPDTANLKTHIHLRDNGIRPYIELEPNQHPLAVEQREGITVERLAEIYAIMMHET